MGTLHYEEQLFKIFANVNDWLKFAEAKNFGLVTVNAAIVFGFSQSNISGTFLTSGLYIFLPFAAASFFVSLISLFPIVSKIEGGLALKKGISGFSNWIDTEKSFENIHFYGYL